MKFNYANLTPFKGFVLQNFPFIEADFDAITSYQLYCDLVKYLNKVIESENIVGTQLENLTNAFNDLTNYVDNYFNNLDVQEEINNKLDEMAEDGQLVEIISAYLELNALMCYNSLDDMKNATNLINGSFARIYGKLLYNDGQGAFYKIRELINTDVVDNDNIVALTNYPTLIAEKIPNSEITQINNNLTQINTKINNLENAQNPIGLYRGKNLVVFGDSFTDPVNNNSLNGYWVNRVASVTGMNSFNFAKGGASLMRTANSYRMQVNRAITEMTQTEKDNTSIIIMYLCDTDILEDTNIDDYVSEYEQLCTLLVQNFVNAKIIVAPFTWRCNKLYNNYFLKMSNYIWNMKRWTNFPCIFLENCMYWLLGIPGYYQNEYHPNQNGYMVIADKFINAIYGGDAGNILDCYDVTLNLDDQTDDRRCTVIHHNGFVTVEFYCVFSANLTNKYDWIANFPKIAIPQPDIVAPLMTSVGECVGAFNLTSANNGRANLRIKNLTAGTPVFLAPLTFRAVANFEY